MKHKSNSSKIQRAVPELSEREKKLLSKVSAADPEEGCRTSNQQLEKLLGIGERQIRSTLTMLRVKKLVTVRFERGERSIHATAKLTRLLSK